MNGSLTVLWNFFVLQHGVQESVFSKVMNSKAFLDKLWEANKRIDRLEDRYKNISGIRYQMLVDTVPDAVIVADSKGTILFWNRAAEEMFGYPYEEIVGKNTVLIMPERYREAHTKGLEAAASKTLGTYGYVGSRAVFDGLHKDGTEFPIEITLYGWREDGKPCYGANIRKLGQVPTVTVNSTLMVDEKYRFRMIKELLERKDLTPEERLTLVEDIADGGELV